MIIDVDDNRRTGEGGADVLVTVGGGEVSVERWERAPAGSPTTSRLARASVRAATSSLVDLHVSELENTRRFGFSLAALDVNTAEQQIVGIDLAPDNGAFWRYTLANKAAVKLVFTKSVTKPARPRAGKSFTVGFAATRSDTGRGIASGTVGCRVLVAGEEGAREGTDRKRGRSVHVRRAERARPVPCFAGRSPSEAPAPRWRGTSHSSFSRRR